MDIDIFKKYYTIPMVGNTWTCPDCKVKLIVNRKRLLKTQIRQHVSSFLHARNAKKEEQTRQKIEELEEILELLVDVDEDEE